MDEKEPQKIPQTGYYIAHFNYREWAKFLDLPSHLPIGTLTGGHIAYLLKAGQFDAYSGWPRSIWTRDKNKKFTDKELKVLRSNGTDNLDYEGYCKLMDENKTVFDYPFEKVVLTSTQEYGTIFPIHPLFANSATDSARMNVYKHHSIRTRYNLANHFMQTNKIPVDIVESLFDEILVEVATIMEYISLVKQSNLNVFKSTESTLTESKSLFSIAGFCEMQALAECEIGVADRNKRMYELHLDPKLKWKEIVETVNKEFPQCYPLELKSVDVTVKRYAESHGLPFIKRASKKQYK